MATIRYPGGFGMALAQGLPAFAENYARGEDERRRREIAERGATLQEAAGRRSESEFGQRQALQQALPPALARFAGQLAQSTQAPTVITATSEVMSMASAYQSATAMAA